MYNYEWDLETGGYILTAKLSRVTKEVRPVFYQELDLLGFNKYWSYPKGKEPLLWAEARRYIYKGRVIAETKGGGLYTRPALKVYEDKLELEPVNTMLMVEKNKTLMGGLIQNSLQLIYKTYLEYRNRKVNVIYVAFSGGKDSLVLLDLTQRALPHSEFKVIFSDTSMEISATYKALERAEQRWSDVKFYRAKSHLDAKDSWELFGPPSRTQRWCCSVHKTAPSLLKLREITRRDKLKALVLDGVRAEESPRRAAYSVISDGQKHATQINCRPLLNWGAAEIYLYLFERDLFLNDAYKYGVTRVGCAICPLSSPWREFIVNNIFENDTKPFIDIIKKNVEGKFFNNEKELDKYLDKGGWKGRTGGRNLKNGGNRIIEQTSKDYLILNVNEQRSSWKEWMKTLGAVTELTENKYSVEYRKSNHIFDIEEKNGKLKVKIQNQIHNKESIRFLYLFKNVFYKTAYCVKCRNCEVECPQGVLHIKDDGIRIDKGCIHCESCLDMPKGCLAAKSLLFTMGGNCMSLKGIDRYKTFGFRKIWLNYFIEEKDNFWQSGKLGKYQLDGFRVWLKEAELITNGMFNDLAGRISALGVDDTRVWAIIAINLVYNSPIMNWYVRTVEFNVPYSPNSIVALLGDALSISTRENAVTSLKETFRYSPIGRELGLGVCDVKGNAIVSITRIIWANPDPLIILYSLYKFAEKSDGYYSFTLNYLCDHSVERVGISPTQIFGVDRKTMKEKLQNLATDYKEFISVSFSKDLDNIDLNKNKTSLEVVELF